MLLAVLMLSMLLVLPACHDEGYYRRHRHHHGAVHYGHRHYYSEPVYHSRGYRYYDDDDYYRRDYRYHRGGSVRYYDRDDRREDRGSRSPLGRLRDRLHGD